MRFILDTNIASAIGRDPYGTCARRAASHEGEIGVSVIVAAEIRFGLARSKSVRLAARMEALLDALPVLPLEPPFDRVYGDLRAALERGGIGVSAMDLMIAAHALTLDCVLVTDDRVFAEVPGLSVENWLRA